MIFRQGLTILIAIIPIVIVIVGLMRKFAAERARSCSPFTEKLLRPPGESVRLKISDIEEWILDSGLILIALLVFPAFALILAPLQSISAKLIGFLSIPCLC